MWVFRGVLTAIIPPVGWEVVTNGSKAKRGERRKAERGDVLDFLAFPNPYFQPFPENWLHSSSGSMSHPCHLYNNSFSLPASLEFI